ncbi:unnamed protein product [Leptidea sinapis]|uniref:Zinc finger Sec23/Sec24-type domain-containing protein n=1 Tax=Leptidea sinapis TaxID=189913 RepID=A0A5E4PSK8_9NEOP|nr:unnamed protein product [Leptidea sinapis]
MSNITNPYNTGPQHPNLGPYQFNQPNQLPGLPNKQDANSNNPYQVQGLNNQSNHNSQSASSSPAFNHPSMMPTPPPNILSSSMRQPVKPIINQSLLPNIQNIPPSNPSPRPMINTTSSSPYHPNPQIRQINDNAPPLISSSQYNQPLMNGPSSLTSKAPMNQYPVSSTSILPPPIGNQATVSGLTQMPPFPLTSMSSNPTSQHNAPLGSMPRRNSPIVPGPPTSSSIPNVGPPRNNALNGPPVPGAPFSSMSGQVGPPRSINSGPSSLPVGPMSGIQMRPTTSQPMQSHILPPRMTVNTPIHPNIGQGPPNQSMGYPGPNMSGPQSLTGPEMAPIGQINKQGQQQSNMQNRYPLMPPSNFPPQQAKQNVTGLSQQMGNLSVTQQGFNQLWGHQMVDLLQCRHILPEYPEEPPEIRLAAPFADASNCSPEIFRCTINRIPDTNSLLQKSRLPLGILIHPFKDLNHLPVIQCTTIVRCRACRTYINPFVYFVDAKRWKCNLCYRVNDLPEEFQYDPVSKTYGDPTRRPEIKSATIEFIAPSEYMLRPPQPAVYLFLLDVSQIARESGYLQVCMLWCSWLSHKIAR